MKTTRLLLGLALLSVTLMASECAPLFAPFAVPLTDVELANASNQPIHILSEGESFAPGNQLQPSTSRIVTERLIESQAIEFRAGRNGAVLDTVQCTPIDNAPFTAPSVGSLSPEVVWDGASLICVGWTV